MHLKTCSKCRTPLPASEFHVDNRRPDGRFPQCKPCRKEYHEANRDHALSRMKQYRQANLQQLLERGRKYEADNRETRRAKCRRYAKDNPEIIAAKNLRREARKAALPATFTPDDWGIALAAFDNTCAYCGGTLEGKANCQQDHVVPVSKGGGYEPGNIVPACKSCNISKNARDWEPWMVERGFDIDRFVSGLIRIHDAHEDVKVATA